MVGIISPMITGIIIILVLTITIMLIIWKGVSNIYKLTQPKQLGGSCVVPTDCAGANLDVFSPGVTCCAGTCQNKKRDWFGSWYCPAECKSSIGAQPGSC